MPPASLSPKSEIASSVRFCRLRKQTILPKVLMEFRMRLVREYLEAFYNTKRIHSHCDYMSPNDYEELYRRLQQNEEPMAS